MINQENKPDDYNNENNNQPISHLKQKNNSQIILSDRSFGGLQFNFTDNPLTEIENCIGITIKQDIGFFEMLTGFERNIIYNIFGETSQGYKYLFKCEENTSCISRWMCPTSIRKLDMNFLHISLNKESKKIANLLKPFKCSCFCLSRPEIFLKLNESNEKIGRITEPFSCSEYLYEIYDESDQIKYMVKGKCCQCGLICANSIFGRIGEADFCIIDPDTKEQIGSISKKNPVISNGINDGENFKIIFPDKASTNDKLLLITLGLMIDYLYFEIDPSK